MNEKSEGEPKQVSTTQSLGSKDGLWVHGTTVYGAMEPNNHVDFVLPVDVRDLLRQRKAGKACDECPSISITREGQDARALPLTTAFVANGEREMANVEPEG